MKETRTLLTLITLVSLFACSPSKRLSRLIALHPDLVKSDTVRVIDTTVVPGVVHDTIFKSTITKDTITIIDKQLTIKYYNDGKTTYIKGVCDTVFVVKEIPVTVHTVSPIKEVTVYPFWAYPALWVAILYIALTLAYVLRRMKII